MTDKEKIRNEVERLMNDLIQEKEKGYGSDIDDACILELQNLLTFIDSLQEEPVSNDLEEASDNYVGHAPEIDEDLSCFIRRNAFIAGAKWKKKRLMENAVEAVIHPYDGEIWVDKDLLSVYNDCQHVKLIIIEGEHFFELGLKK